MRHLSVLALLPLLLTACPKGDNSNPDQGEVSGTLTPYRSSTASLDRTRTPPLLGLAREVQRLRQDRPALALSQSLDAAPSPLRSPAPLARLPRGERAVPGELLVGFEPGPQALGADASPARLAQAARTRVAAALPGLSVEHRAFLGPTAHRIALKRAADGRAPSEAETEAAARALRAQPGVRYVERNLRMYRLQAAPVTPDDQYFELQWHYRIINLPTGWEFQRNATGVVVAVIDSGIRPHPDLDPHVLPGYDFIADAANAGDGDGLDPNPIDVGGDVPGGSTWHGSHVAGTVGAVSDNAIGVSGVGWNVRLLPVRVLGLQGGDAADVAAAMRWAVGLDVPGVPTNENPAKVVNLSLGGTGDPLQSYQDIIDEAAHNPRVPGGSVFVIAAGNENVDAAQTVPCNQANVICVGSVGFSGVRSSFSDFGAIVDVMAPGGEMREDLDADRRPDGVLSTVFDASVEPSYAFLQGTSMAAPHVSGVVALMAAERGSANPLTPAEAETLLKETANPTSQCAEGCGAGMINALGAITRAGGSAPTGAPVLSLTTPAMAFVQGGRATQAVHLANAGGGTLAVTLSAQGPEAARLSFPGGASVSLGPGEAQSIRVSADLNGLPPGAPQASLALDAGAAGNATIPVRLRAGTFEDKDALVVFAFQDDKGEFQASDDTSTIARAAEGYTYRIKLDPNTYFAVAGIDDNGNGEAFEDGERTGFWRNLDNLEPIELPARGRVSDINFDLVPFTTLASSPTPAAPPIPLR